MQITALAMLPLLFAGASAQVSKSCDAQYTKVSAACCSAPSSRRLGEGMPELSSCAMPSTCSKACAAVFPSYYESCADASNLPESLDAFYTKCSANAPKWSMLRARCTTDYTLGSFRGASAQAQALAKCNSAGSKCSGIYASSCRNGVPSKTSYSSFYLCKAGLFFSKSSYSCVFPKPGVAIVAPPKDACLPATNPCKNGGKCSSYISGSTSRARCTCAKGTKAKTASGVLTYTGKYVGTFCQTLWKDACLSSPCLNGATCRGSTYRYSYSCSCAHLYGSTNCAVQFDDPCESDPCQNGGTCTSYSSTYSKAATASCRCTPGFLGQHCEMMKAPDPPTCKGSMLQRCRMMCPPARTQCAQGMCSNHTDNCCGRACVKIQCSAKDCCHSSSTKMGPQPNSYCHCKDQAICKRVSCEATAPAGTCTITTPKACTAAQTAAGMTLHTASNCGTACPLTCGKAKQQYCNPTCILGCQCGPNLYLDNEVNKCVPVKSCSTPPPPPGPLIAIGRPFTTANSAGLTAAGAELDEAW